MRKAWYGVVGIPLGGIFCLYFVSQDIGLLRAKTEARMTAKAEIPAKVSGSQPSRIEADSQLENDFMNPPKAYGPVPLWWWAGEHLDKERLKWQLDQLHEKGVESACVIYPYKLEYIKGDKTPYSYDPAYAPGSMTMVPDLGDPPVFSTAWWAYFRWMVQECKKRGMTIWFSDYTRNNEAQREIAARHLELKGLELECLEVPAKTSETVALSVLDSCEIISAMAYPLLAQVPDRSLAAINLTELVRGDSLHWQAKAGSWNVYVVYAKAAGFDAVRPQSGEKLADYIYGEFDRQCPGELGKTIAGFFTDELSVSRGKIRWDENFAHEFRRQKGYDITPFLPALWHDIGPRSAKTRIDYYDVLITLMEKNFFQPTFNFMEAHGLLHSHDQAGRHSMQVQTVWYGDYYRTMRWYNAPGYDDYGGKPAGQRNFRDAKLASSIAHLYQRPRVWCEAFHSSGWGLTPADMVAWTNENYVYGANVYDHHGLYYTTYGGWWEWAPPSAHFRQPYWRHYGEFSRYVNRLSFLLSQGVHRCDVAILYPTTTMQANVTAGSRFSQEAVNADAATWGLGLDLFRAATDFDYLDHESLELADIHDKKLHIKGNEFSVLVLPACSAIRYSTLKKALSFYRGGGIVLAYGCLPSQSDLAPEDAHKLGETVKEIFGLTGREAEVSKTPTVRKNAGGGLAAFFPGQYQYSYPADLSNSSPNRSFLPLKAVLDSAICRDFTASVPGVYVLHQATKKHDVYFVYNVRDDATATDAFFRVLGRPQRWDAWSGSISPVSDFQREDDGTTIRLRFEPHEAKVIVFAREEKSLDREDRTAHTDDEQIGPSNSMDLDGLWDFELIPTLDNRWGDFRLPATNSMIGAEARRFKYSGDANLPRDWYQPNFDDSDWAEVTYSFGPYFWQFGPFSPTDDWKGIETEFLQLLDAEKLCQEIGGSNKRALCQLYSFSRRWGIENDPVLLKEYENAVGLKQHVPDEFIDLGVGQPGSFYYLWTTVTSDGQKEAFLILSATGPCQAWVNGQQVLNKNGIFPVQLNAGTNRLLIRLEQRGDVRIRCYAVLGAMPRIAPSFSESVSARLLGLRWFDQTIDPVYDVYSQRKEGIGHYRFFAPPGLDKMTIVAHGQLEAWIQGESAAVAGEKLRSGGVVYHITPRKPQATCSVVALRIKQKPGFYAGAAIPEPIAIDCKRGRTQLADWSQLGLSTYSGAARYFRTLPLTEQQISNRIVLDLGRLSATAEVIVNNQIAAIRFAPPFRFDVSAYLKTGQNQIEVIVTNTLANHYRVGIPTKFINESQMVSGLLGPVKITFAPRLK